jgi:hypothetical protein
MCHSSKEPIKKNKVVYNLKDINQKAVFIKDLSPEVMMRQRYCNQFSLYMIHHAQVRIERHNYFLREKEYLNIDPSWPALS